MPELRHKKVAANSLQRDRKQDVKPNKQIHASKLSHPVKKVSREHNVSKDGRSSSASEGIGKVSSSVSPLNSNATNNVLSPESKGSESDIKKQAHSLTGGSISNVLPVNPAEGDCTLEAEKRNDSLPKELLNSNSANPCNDRTPISKEFSSLRHESELRSQTPPKLPSNVPVPDEQRSHCAVASEAATPGSRDLSPACDEMKIDIAHVPGAATSEKPVMASVATPIAAEIKTDTTSSGAAVDDDSLEDRFSIDEDIKDFRLRLPPVLTKLASDWERYFVTVGDWLVSATEGADSNPPSDHEEEGAADANKAGFASGLASFNLSGVSSRASASAKTVGSFFGTAFSKASASVKEAGSKIKETVEKNPLLTEFNKEQEAFIAAKGGKPGEALPPWVGYPNEEKLKEEILSLSTERKNFVRNPPTGVIFEFDLDQFLPVAQATLAADPSLEKMRFELVPKVVSEEVFWRNYFYRVGLIRQSTELSSMEQDGEAATKAPSENKAPTPEPAAAVSAVTEAVASGASENIEFVSESFQPTSEDLEDIKRDVSNLTQSEEKGEEDWEAELREELGGFEVVEGGGSKTAGKGDDQWEEEIQNMIDEEDDDTSDLR